MIVVYEKAVIKEVFKALKHCIKKCEQWGIPIPKKKLPKKEKPDNRENGEKKEEEEGKKKRKKMI